MRVQPHICAVYPLDETAQALTYVAEGRAIGKVLIDVS
jgi:NADPH2:quinone reductase